MVNIAYITKTPSLNLHIVCSQNRQLTIRWLSIYQTVVIKSTMLIGIFSKHLQDKFSFSQKFRITVSYIFSALIDFEKDNKEIVDD